MLLLATLGASSFSGAALTRSPVPLRSRRLRARPFSQEDLKIDPIDIQILQQQLQAVRNLPRIANNGTMVSRDGWWRSAYADNGDSDEFVTSRSYPDVLEDDLSREPSFRRLFTHETWFRYTGQPPFQRWFRSLYLWRYSTVSRAVFPCVALAFAWSMAVCMTARESRARK